MNTIKRTIITILLLAAAGVLYAALRTLFEPEPEPPLQPFPLPPLVVAAATKLMPGRPPDVVEYGRSIALSGDTIAVGAPNYVGPGFSRPGIVYIYEHDGQDWVEQAQLQAAAAGPGQPPDRFGQALALDGDILAVGATGEDDAAGENVGAVYIFQRQGNEWLQQARLLPGDATAFGGFGAHLALSRDTLVVARQPQFNPGDTLPLPEPIYIFRRQETGWIEQAQLFPGDPISLQRFGPSLAIDGDTIAVGAVLSFSYSEHMRDRFMEGAVYIFERHGDTWQEQGWLVPGDSPGGNGFGQSVALSGDTLLVGAGLDSDVGLHAGAIYVFERSGPQWRQQAKLTAGDGAREDFFGVAALDGDTAVVGAPGSSQGNYLEGAVYIFQRHDGVWYDQLRLVPGDPENSLGIFFGGALALDGSTLLIAAPSEYGHAAYVYHLR